MFDKYTYAKYKEQIRNTKKNYSLLFKKFCYIIKNGGTFEDIQRDLKINWRTFKRMEQNYKLLDKIHSLTPKRAIKEGLFTTLNELKLFEFLVSGENFFLKYNDVKKHIKISRYFYKRVREFIVDELN